VKHNCYHLKITTHTWTLNI